MGSAAQTLAILSSQQKTSQSAQVKDISRIPTLNDTDEGSYDPRTGRYTVGCLTIEPRFNKFFSNSFNVSQEYFYSEDYTYYNTSDIKNNCSRSISIIDPLTLSTIGKNFSADRVNTVALEYLDEFGQGVNIPLPENNLGITSSTEMLTCHNCGQEATQLRLSPVGTATYQNASAIRTITLAPGEVKNFELYFVLGVPHSSLSTYWLRIKPTKILWMYDNAYNDGSISSSEIRSADFTPAFQNMIASDYMNVPQDTGGYDGCQLNGQTMDFNDLGEVVCQ